MTRNEVAHCYDYDYSNFLWFFIFFLYVRHFRLDFNASILIKMSSWKIGKVYAKGFLIHADLYTGIVRICYMAACMQDTSLLCMYM